MAGMPIQVMAWISVLMAIMPATEAETIAGSINNPDVIYRTEREKYSAIIEEIERIHKFDTLLLNDGLLKLTVDQVLGEQVRTTVVVGGELSNNKGINKAGGGLTAPALTAKDMEDIRTAMSFQCEYLAVSFPKNATDMEMARQLANVAGEATRHKPAMIAKIERSEAIPVLEAILRASDGIMVARGDLAIEVGNAAVPALQKKMIRMAREMDKIVITATQMMESMISNPVPTRAEVSDVRSEEQRLNSSHRSLSRMPSSA